MNDKISSRHESDLGARFLPFGETDQVAVTIIVSPEDAHRISVQHTSWMLMNLLSRQKGIVDRIGLICPPSVPCASRIIPFARTGQDLGDALIAGNQSIGIVPVVANQRVGRVLLVGSSPQFEPVDTYVAADGWCGGISTSRPSLADAESDLPFGPYIAACLAAGEIFKAARLCPQSYSCPDAVFYSAWTRSPSRSFISAGPRSLEQTLEFALGGVGAVGCAFLHALYACPGISGKVLLADSDEKGLEASNLNRYVLFGLESVGHQKATEAARLLAASTLVPDPRDQSLESIAVIPELVVSAVDSNLSRAAIQNRYPAQILSASTHDLRAEVLRCGPPGEGACLRCYNPPDVAKSDEQIATEIQIKSDDELQSIAQAAGITITEMRQWSASQKCGMAGEAVLKYFRNSEPRPHGFAVGFVSVMAGTLLAAEVAATELQGSTPKPKGNRSVFQFWSPAAAANRSSDYIRDPQCPMCRPDSHAVAIWNKRLHELRYSNR